MSEKTGIGVIRKISYVENAVYEIEVELADGKHICTICRVDDDPVFIMNFDSDEFIEAHNSGAIFMKPIGRLIGIFHRMVNDPSYEFKLEK